MKRVLNTVHWKRYLDWTRNDRVKRFVESRGNSVFLQIAQNIRKAHTENKKQLTMVVHEYAPSAIRIPSKDYLEVINLCLKWFEINEDYETCTLVKRYKSHLIKSKKKIKKPII
jgi:hypothetical protein